MELGCAFAASVEDDLGPRWQQRFELLWPGYRSWFLRGGMSERPTYLACRRALREHLPLWLPAWECMVELAGGGDVAARFLSMWCPPPYIAGCSQGVWQGDGGPLLVRNYDYAPVLLEGAWLSSRWARQRVVAMSDCLCGALDGINEAGLALSLSFGGRKTTGTGFGIPLVLRYLLEFSESTDEALALLGRIPVHMTYSITLLDRTGHAATAFVAPDRPLEALPARAVANHQHRIEWPEHARATHSTQRAEQLRYGLAAARDADAVVRTLLAPPLYQNAFDRGYGTLYSALYRPQTLGIELAWPEHRWAQSVNDFREGQYTARYVAPARGDERAE